MPRSSSTRNPDRRPSLFPQLVTFDFHNTLIACDEWFFLEIRDLPVATIEAIAPETLDRIGRDAITDAYRELRHGVIESGIEIDSISGVVSVFDELGIHIDRATVEATVRRIMTDAVDHCTLLPGALEAVQSLHQTGIRLGVISSAVHHAFLDEALAKFGLLDAFDFVITSASCGHYKSDPAIFTCALETGNATAETTIHIGDSARFDVDIPRSMGMRAILVRNAMPTGANTFSAEFEPTVTVDDLRDAAAWILDLRSQTPLRIDIFTLFPAMFTGYFGESIIKRAQAKGLIDLQVHDIRDWTHDRHHTADDTPYGGGAGMVMKVEPIIEAVEAVLGEDKDSAHIAIMSAGGRRFTQSIAGELSTSKRIALICGHYEGIDERVSDILDADELSIGDFVLTGGELPAMTIADAVIRLIPGVITEASIQDESHAVASRPGVEYPHYTRPAEFRGHTVPDVLLSGNHAKIDAWRAQRALDRTRRWRPDLLVDDV